jgi:hypothetical protein
MPKVIQIAPFRDYDKEEILFVLLDNGEIWLADRVRLEKFRIWEKIPLPPPCEDER